ncbi:uroporphyrinogen-III synthase [Crocinitomicaceae bacterium]|nr:uroporphyrinogen-III synthase [Crocinitomicaceae bacterium]
MSTLFISKKEEDLKSHFHLFKAKSITVIAHSFLQFEAVPFNLKSVYQALFFGSPRAVQFFLQQEEILDNTFIGCIGEVTAKPLLDKGIKVDFIGKSAGNPSEVAQQFKEEVGDKRVLFPQSLSSNRSVVRVFPLTQVEEISIYKTVIVPQNIPDCSIYVFTSPSNVDGFLKENSIPVNAKVIAWGSTTANHIISKNLSVDIILKEASIEELISVLG